jgi:hypothetical protein
VNDRILTEDNVDGLVLQGHRARLDEANLDLVRKTRRGDLLSGMGDDGFLDIKSHDATRAMNAREQNCDAPRATPDVHDGPVRKIQPVEHARDFVGPARRQKPVAPNRF